MDGGCARAKNFKGFCYEMAMGLRKRYGESFLIKSEWTPCKNVPEMLPEKNERACRSKRVREEWINVSETSAHLRRGGSL